MDSRLLHIITGDMWAGAEVQALATFEAIAEICVTPPVVVTFNEGQLSETLKRAGFDVRITDERKKGALIIFRELVRILSGSRIEIVHTHGYKETFLGGLAARASGVHTILRTHHGKGVLYGSLKHSWIERINRSFLTDHNIAVSDDLKRYLIQKGYRGTTITVIRNGINPAKVRPSKSTFQVRSELQIPQRALVIGSMGRLVPVKNYELFVRGAREIATRFPDAFFVLAGDGSLKRTIEKMAESLGIGDRFKLLGFRNDAYDILSIFDIFVITSLHEGIPMSLLEAMAMAKPIVSTAVGGIPEILSNGENGLLIPSNDRSSFTKACLAICEDRLLRTRIGFNAQRDVIRKHNTDVVADQLLRLYHQVSA